MSFALLLFSFRFDQERSLLDLEHVPVIEIQHDLLLVLLLLLLDDRLDLLLVGHGPLDDGGVDARLFQTGVGLVLQVGLLLLLLEFVYLL